MYQCEVQSVHGFIQQLAVCYVAHGYYFYQTGWIPERKDPRLVDEKLIDRYGISVSSSERWRRKRAGLGNVQYLRHGQFFVLLCTHGFHSIREEEKNIRDVRRLSVKYGGYEVTFRNGHARVSITQKEFKRLKASFVELATRLSSAELAEEFSRLPFEPYAPVRRQFLTIFRAVNRVRDTQGLSRVEKGCLRLRRKIYRPFGV